MQPSAEGRQMALWRRIGIICQGKHASRCLGSLNTLAHLSLEEPRNLLPVQRVEVKFHQFLGDPGFYVPAELLTELIDGELLRQTGFQLCA